MTSQLVHHNDAEREWAYDRASHIGKLDKALDEANAKGWTVVDRSATGSGCFPLISNEDGAGDVMGQSLERQ